MLSEQEKEVNQVLVMIKEYYADDPTAMKFNEPLLIDGSSSF